MKKKTIVIVYEYFYPGFKGGGPIQSLLNLVTTLQDYYIFKVITTAYDLNETSSYANVPIDKWTQVQLPGMNGTVAIFYSSKHTTGLSKMALLLKEANADIIFIAGLFTSWSSFPLLVTKNKKFKTTMVVVSPRGMLQKGALALGATKKKLFLWIFKKLNLHKNVVWHATDEQESEDIRLLFGKDSVIKIAFNIPKVPYVGAISREKPTSQLRMVYLSLITEKKNLHFILESIKEIKTPVEFDIYGPVKDEIYWRKCGALMKGQIHKINYLGLANPVEVQKLLSGYHVFVLPTKGENFGHAIYEALSVGTPAIITGFTPWGRLQDSQSGFTVESLERNDWVKAIQMFIDYDQIAFNKLSQGAYELASNYFYKNDFKSTYASLFGPDSNND